MRRLILGFIMFSACIVSTPAFAACPDKDLGAICQHHDIFLMPGGQAVFFAPAGQGIDAYFGAGLHLALISWAHNNALFGPSHGELYFEASLLGSSGVSTLGIFEGGFKFSLERNASRRWLIPFYGVGLGGTVNEDIPDSAYVTPLVGLNVFWHPNAQVALLGAYHVPFSYLDDVRGVRAQLVAQISFW